MINTVVALDLADYTKPAHRIEGEVGSPGVAALNKQIQRLVDEGLEAARVKLKVVFRKATGDGALVVFNNPLDAHDFAIAFHEVCAAYNAAKQKASERRWFRVGAATGELDQTSEDIAGVSIIRAVRSEGAGIPGYILIDAATYGGLPKRSKMRYGPKKTMTSKGRRYCVHWSKAVKLPEREGEGIVPREKLHASSERLPGEVFAVELLKRPITIERNESGHVSVTIDRNGVRKMLISNAAKTKKCQDYITPANKPQLEILDRKIQKFLAGKKTGKMRIDLREHRICMRWASGGVLSIIRFAGDPEQTKWVPFFFRDIHPYGWNISLGQPERRFSKDDSLKENYSHKRELNWPWNYIKREFLEESLVVHGRPKPGSQLFLKRFAFKHDEPGELDEQGEEFDQEHIELRNSEDGFEINEGKSCIMVEPFKPAPDCSVIVKDESGTPHATIGVLVCFSLLDLGIEVVKVVQYEIERSDYMLDGEILVRDSAEGRTERELVRMPIALMSLDYLERTFGRDDDWHCYTYGPQPSIKVPRAPDPKRGDIRLFDWDARRRMEVVGNKGGTDWQRERFGKWYDMFGQHFVADRKRPADKWKLSCTHPSRLFVPGTAKILNLYFSMLRK